jgi:uncharacterized protein
MISRLLNLSDLLGTYGSALLLGPRGTGKTQMAMEWLKSQRDTLHYNLLDPSDFRRLLEEPAQLKNEIETKLAKSKGVLSVFIDEVQKVPPLLDLCHLLIEEHKRKVRFLVTGSSARKLRSSGVNLLAGRAFSLRLHPFTVAELVSSDSRFSLLECLKTGTLPSVLGSENPAMSLRAYVDTYLKEEIQQEALVRKLDKFFRFIDLAAQLSGEPVNFKKFARQLQISDKTAADYFQILVDTLLVMELPGWDRSVKKQILRGSKFYFFDCGVLNAAAGELNATLAAGSSRFGRLFEQLVISELYRMNDYFQKDFKLYFYSNGQSEVDLVLSRGLKSLPIGIEIKSSAKVRREDLSGLALFSAEYPKAPLYCVTPAEKSYHIDLSPKSQVTVLSHKDAAKEILGL